MKISKSIFRKNVHIINSNEVIFKEGEPGQYMYVIISGQVEIRKRTEAQLTRTITTLRQGDIFGEMAIIEKKKRSATIIALTECQLLRLNETMFYEIVRNNPDFAIKIIRSLSARLRKTNTLIEEILSLDFQEQIMLSIQEYLKTQGRASTKDTVFFNGQNFCRWATLHRGISAKLASMGLSNMLEKKILRIRTHATDGNLIGISKRLLNRDLSIHHE